MLRICATIARRRHELTQEQKLQRYVIVSLAGLLEAYREHPRRSRKRLLRAAELATQAYKEFRPEFADASAFLLTQAGKTMLEVVDLAEELPSLQFIEVAGRRKMMSVLNGISAFNIALKLIADRDFSSRVDAKLGLAKGSRRV